MNEHGGDEQALKVAYDDRIGGRGGGRAWSFLRKRETSIQQSYS